MQDLSQTEMFPISVAEPVVNSSNSSKKRGGTECCPVVEINSLYPSRALIDKAALIHNISVLSQRVPGKGRMAILKADAYGHGRKIVAEAALTAGIDYFGVAQLEEALTLRQILDEIQTLHSPDCRFPQIDYQSEKIHEYCLESLSHGETVQQSKSRNTLQTKPFKKKLFNPRIFTWLYPPELDWEVPLLANLEISVSHSSVLPKIAEAARRLGKTSLVHLKIDTGMGRGGSTLDNWSELLCTARQIEKTGALKVVGVWSHLAQADNPNENGKQAVICQVEKFETATRMAKEIGFINVRRHLAATSGTLWHPETHYDLLRFGIGMYGLSPNPEWQTGHQLNLTPVMTLQAQLVLVKKVKAGQTVSYGGTWTAPQDTTLAIVPLGYADGIPRQASNKLGVTANGQYYPQVGRICMDQMMIDLGNDSRLKIGDWVTLFGIGTAGQLTADHWAAAADTINYTIVTQLGPRVPRLSR